jgi:hypothetical protein
MHTTQKPEDRHSGNWRVSNSSVKLQDEGEVSTKDRENNKTGQMMRRRSRAWFGRGDDSDYEDGEEENDAV